MSVPLLGRNAQLFKDGLVIGYGKNISVKASAELIKEYSMEFADACNCGSWKTEFQMVG